MNKNEYTVIGLMAASRIQPGDDLGVAFADAMANAGLSKLLEMDVVVVASKVVSISERRLIELATVKASKEALEISNKTGKDARLIELVLRESTSHRLASPKGPIIAWHKLGYELTSAGVDNAGEGGAYLLPEDPDQSAASLALKFERLFSVKQLGVIIADSDGRPDRAGATAIAIGSAGFEPLRRTQVEVDGRLKTQDETIVDMIAAAACVVIGQRGRGVPFAVVRGLELTPSNVGLRSILHHR